MKKVELGRRSHTPRWLAILPLIVATLGACTDQQPLPSVPQDAPQTVYAPTSTWRGHWNSPLELWVYDKTPEMGMNTHLHRGELYDVHFAHFRRAGMRIVRHTLFWQLADRNGDWVYDAAYLADFRRKVDLAKAYGIELLVVVHGMELDRDHVGLPWDASTTQADFDARFTRFLREMTLRFPEIKLWQVWNEQDADVWARPWMKFNGYDWTAAGRGYARTLAAVYPVLAADTSRWVILGGLTGQRPEFLQGMYAEMKQRGQPYPFDIFALHGYGATPFTGDGSFKKVHSMTPVMNNANDVNRPIWVTEAGTGGGEYVKEYGRWPTGDIGAVFDQEQRAYWQSLALDMTATPVTKVVGYSLFTGGASAPPTDLPDGRSAKDYDASLLRKDAVTERPAYDWLEEHAGMLRARWNYAPVVSTFRIRTNGQVPASHPYHYEGDVIVIENVVVNSLTPTIIRMKWPPAEPTEPTPCSRSCPPQY